MNFNLLKYYIALQPKFRDENPEIFAFHSDKVCNSCIWIPRTIDDSSEEARKRSLWGMVEGRKKIKELSSGVSLLMVWEDSNILEYEGNTPTEAMLKALVAQWGVEVKG